MKIIKIALKNFQGIKNFTFALDGENADIYGDNGTGKTTLVNAFFWLMSGKPSTDEKNYSPKTAGTHSLNHVAEIVVEHDGVQKTLKKDFHEVYTTKRGNRDKVFSGHTTEFYVDGVPMAEKEYNAVIEEICPKKIFDNISRIGYFLEDYPVKDRRALLLELCGDIDDAAVFKSEKALKELPEILKNRTIDDYMKIVKVETKKVNEGLKEIPNRIDEAERGKPEVSGTESTLKYQLEKLGEKKRELESKRLEATAAPESGIIAQIAKVKAEKEEAKAEHAEKENQKNKDVNERLHQLEIDLNGATYRSKELVSRIDLMKRNIESAKEEREDLIALWQKENEKQWEGDTVCPTCGRELPEDQIEQAKKAFNLQKSRELEKITEKGKSVSKEVIADMEQEADELIELKTETENAIQEIEDRIVKEKANLKHPVIFEATEICYKFEKQIKELERQRSSVSEENRDRIAEIDSEIASIDRQADGIRSDLAAMEQVKKADARIKELEARQDELSAQAEELERGKYLCELFTRRKAELLDDTVNSRFETLKFRLFDEQINGGIKDDCEALIPCGDTSVPFKSANTASRINAALEMIAALQEYYGIEMPVWVDGCESITRPKEIPAQTIRMHAVKQKKEEEDLCIYRESDKHTYHIDGDGYLSA